MSDKCCGVPLLLTLYRDYLDDGNSADFVNAVTAQYSVACLERLTKSTNVEVRRAAVLALGMVGCATAIPPVGACLRDTDRCVRLVAEVAFSDLLRREMGVHAARMLQIAKRDLDGGRYEKALNLLNAVLDVWPKFSDAWYHRAIALYCLGNLSEATDDARQATRLNKYHFSAYVLRGRSLLELEQPGRALDNFQKSLEVYPSQILVRGYIDVLLRQHRRLNHDDSV